MEGQVVLNLAASSEQGLGVFLQGCQPLVEAAEFGSESSARSGQCGVLVLQLCELLFEVLHGGDQVGMEVGGLSGLSGDSDLEVFGFGQLVVGLLVLRGRSAEDARAFSEEVAEEAAGLGNHPQPVEVGLVLLTQEAKAAEESSKLAGALAVRRRLGRQGSSTSHEIEALRDQFPVGCRGASEGLLQTAQLGVEVELVDLDRQAALGFGDQLVEEVDPSPADLLLNIAGARWALGFVLAGQQELEDGLLRWRGRVLPRGQDRGTRVRHPVSLMTQR